MNNYYHHKKIFNATHHNGNSGTMRDTSFMNGIRKYSLGLVEILESGNPYVNNGLNRISVSTIGSIKHEFEPSVFYNNLQPINWFLRGIGVLPLVRPRPGYAKFDMKSLSFLYSFIFFVFLTASVIYVACERIATVRSLSGPFEEAVIAYLFLVNILPIMVVPILWWETQKIARLFNDWDDFEILYYQITGHKLPLDLRNKAIMIALILPILSVISVIVTHITMADLNLVQVMPYCILDNLTAMLGAWWFLVFESLSITANLLAERLQKALKHIGPAALVADYRTLWLRLSKLTRDTGNATCYTFIFMSLYLFFIITLSIYGLMSQLSEGFGIKDIGLTITAFWNVCLLFYICDEAHYASFNVRTNFQKKLLMVELNWMNSNAQTEINMFLRATDMNPTNINCGGFFDINRNLFKGLVTTMVTYLVVLLQFQISLPAVRENIYDKNNTNFVDLLNDIIINNLDYDKSLEDTTSTTTMRTTTTEAVTLKTTAKHMLQRGRKG